MVSRVWKMIVWLVSELVEQYVSPRSGNCVMHKFGRFNKLVENSTISSSNAIWKGVSKVVSTVIIHKTLKFGEVRVQRKLLLWFFHVAVLRLFSFWAYKTTYKPTLENQVVWHIWRLSGPWLPWQLCPSWQIWPPWPPWALWLPWPLWRPSLAVLAALAALTSLTTVSQETPLRQCSVGPFPSGTADPALWELLWCFHTAAYIRIHKNALTMLSQ